VDAYYASPAHLSIDGRPLGSANFLLVAGCCLALDYFAFLFKGGGSDEANAKAFIDRFLQPVESRYSEVGSDHLAVFPSWHGPPQLAKMHCHR